MRRLLSAAILLAACGRSPERTTSHQIVLGPFHLEPGEERQFCWFFELPLDDATAVKRFSQVNGGHTHHFTLYRSDDAHAEGPELCPLFAIYPIYGGTRDQGPAELPAGVAVPLAARQPLIMDLHLFNPEEAPVDETITVTLDVTDPDADFEPAGIFTFSTLDIAIPPHSLATAGGACVFDRDVHLVSVSSHTHALGTNVLAWELDGQGVGGELYRNDRWDAPAITYFPEPPAFPAGTGLQFTCHYRNDGDESVGFGGTADDEMCMVFGYYYPGPEVLFCLIM